jgi:queuosine precursor transporter
MQSTSSQQYKLLIPIASLMTATLIISNTIDTKIFTIGGLDLPAGIILFPLAYLAGDVLTEVYGYSTSRRIIWSAFAALVLTVVSYEVARALPAAGFWKNQTSFDAVFSHVPRLVVASMCAFLAGEFVNSYLLAKLKIASSGHKMARRFVVSTIVGQFVDTVIFVMIAFGGVFPAAALLSIIASGWAVKVAWEILALPITLPLVRWIKKIEGVDHFDNDTNFSPFKI